MKDFFLVFFVAWLFLFYSEITWWGGKNSFLLFVCLCFFALEKVLLLIEVMLLFCFSIMKIADIQIQ